MNVLIAGRQAVVKNGTSIEYIIENRLFSGSDGYSLSIDFPIADCPNNRDIFGYINRKDVSLGKVRFDCMISDRNLALSGTLTLTKVSDTFVTGQFLEGRSAQNFDDTLDKIYINELDLGGRSAAPSELSPAEAWNFAGNTEVEAVALPWVNDSSDGTPNNFASYNAQSGAFTWDNPSLNLSFFPYLLPLTEKICQTIGYSCDFSAWKNSDWRWLLVCNTLPPTWDVSGYARSLPHWSVSEFFEKLELLMNCHFDINNSSKHISMVFIIDAIKQAGNIQISQVIDTYTSEIAVDEKSADFIARKNAVYKDPGYESWAVKCCDWFINQWPQQALISSYDTFDELWTAIKPFSDYTKGRLDFSSDAAAKRLLYAKDIDMYFLLKLVRKELHIDKKSPNQSYFRYMTTLIPVNEFGKRTGCSDEDADEYEIDFVPVRTDDTDDDHGNAIFLSMASFDEDSQVIPDSTGDILDLPCVQSQPLQAVMKGEKEMSEYFSVINVGFWNGNRAFIDQMPFPFTSSIAISPKWQYRLSNFTLQISGGKSPIDGLPRIDPTVKYSFSFISDSLPNVRAIFFIAGKRYLCEKITATFTENGKSQLLKGDFYPIVD